MDDIILTALGIASGLCIGYIGAYGICKCMKKEQ